MNAEQLFYAAEMAALDTVSVLHYARQRDTARQKAAIAELTKRGVYHDR